MCKFAIAVAAALSALAIFVPQASAHSDALARLHQMQHMQRVMGVRVAKHVPAPAWFRQVLRGFRHPPHMRSWMCIHHYEGSWPANTGNGYWGGLQMDYLFQLTYGAYLLRLRGTANHWTPLEQMWVAERAFRSGRGYGPWPNTARACGLL